MAPPQLEATAFLCGPGGLRGGGPEVAMRAAARGYIYICGLDQDGGWSPRIRVSFIHKSRFEQRKIHISAQVPCKLLFVRLVVEEKRRHSGAGEAPVLSRLSPAGV